METNNSELLNKQKARGEELGKALILSLVNDYTNKTPPEAGPVLNQAELDRMAAGLSTETDRKKYNAYVNLYNNLLEWQSRAEVDMQQMQNGYHRLLLYFTSADLSERVGALISDIPVIVTRKQYEEMKAADTAQKGNLSETLGGLIFTALDFYLGLLRDERERVPAGILSALEGLGGETIEDPFLIALAKEEYGQMPSGLTKRDIIGGRYDLTGWFAGIYSGTSVPSRPDSPGGLGRGFAGGFPALFAALLADVCEKTGLKVSIETAADRLDETVITWGELAGRGLYAYPELAGAVGADILDGADKGLRARALKNGIAVIQDEFMLQSGANIDGKGHYQDNCRQIEGLFTSIDDIQNSELLEYIRQAREVLLKPALAELAAYNAVLGILAKEYGVAEMSGLEKELRPMIDQLHSFNALAESRHHGRQKGKNMAFQRIFPAVEPGGLMPDKKILDQVQMRVAGSMDGEINTHVAALTAGGGQPDG